MWTYRCAEALRTIESRNARDYLASEYRGWEFNVRFAPFADVLASLYLL